MTDLFDTEIKGLSLVEDEVIPDGKTLKNTYQTNYNQFSDEDVLFKSKSISDLKYIWSPEKIIFTDGTTVE